MKHLDNVGCIMVLIAIAGGVFLSSMDYPRSVITGGGGALFWLGIFLIWLGGKLKNKDRTDNGNNI